MISKLTAPDFNDGTPDTPQLRRHSRMIILPFAQPNLTAYTLMPNGTHALLHNKLQTKSKTPLSGPLYTSRHYFRH